MKNFKIFIFLLGTIIVSFVPQPSFGKQIWLKCVSSSGGDTNIIYLDDVSERFEITELFNQTIQGKATFFKSVIKLDYTHQVLKMSFRKTIEIDRANLNYTGTISTVGMGGSGSSFTGICKIIPAPSSKTNKI